MTDVKFLQLYSNTSNYSTVCWNSLTVYKQMTDVKFLQLYSNTSNYFTVCKK